jgi:tetratricopeptide (TPR) repeat protein
MASCGIKRQEDQLNQGSDTAALQEWEKLEEQGNGFYQDLQWPKAIACYTKAIALNPTAAVLYSNRALCHLQLSEFANARDDAENAIRFDPKVVKFYITLSRALQGLKLHPESAKACKAGLEVDPSNEVLLARLMEAQQQSNAADGELEKNLGSCRITAQENAHRSAKKGSSGFKVPDQKLARKPDQHIFDSSEGTTGEPIPNNDELISALTELAMRAEGGSATARKYLRAFELMQEIVCDVLDGDGGISPAIMRRYREARKLWYSVPSPNRFLLKLRKGAEEAVKKV